MAPTENAREDIDAIALLTDDHELVRQLFEDYENLVDSGAGDDERQVLADRICTLLTIHATIEEEIFYPAAREVLEEQDLLDEAEVEHASAKDLIEQIQDMDASEELYDAKLKVLGEYVEHHVREEEDEIFPKARISDMDLETLGGELAERRHELLAEIGEEEEEF